MVYQVSNERLAGLYEVYQRVGETLWFTDISLMHDLFRHANACRNGETCYCPDYHIAVKNGNIYIHEGVDEVFAASLNSYGPAWGLWVWTRQGALDLGIRVEECLPGYRVGLFTFSNSVDTSRVPSFARLVRFLLQEDPLDGIPVQVDGNLFRVALDYVIRLAAETGSQAWGNDLLRQLSWRLAV